MPGKRQNKTQKVEVSVKTTAPAKKKGAKPPRPAPRTKMGGSSVHRVRGNDYFGTVTMKVGDKLGAVKGQVTINPLAWQGTRVQREAQLWQRWRPISLQLEAISSASKMMAGQYVVCWTADPDDEAPGAGPGAIAKAMSMDPSMVKAVHQNGRMRIPCQTTQKWYYVDGKEDKDCDYGKVWFIVAAPLANVTTGSTATIMLRLKWTIEFQMPALPPDATPESTMIFASAPNYFSDSSSDWKGGKYLTFKWHEGGDIVSFPSARTKTPYKCTSDVGFYESNGTLSKTNWAVCVAETTEDGQPMLGLVKNESNAMAWCKNPADNLLISYYAAGPWVTPENPPWFQKEVSVDLLLSRKATIIHEAQPPNAVVCTADASSEKMNRLLQKLVGKEKVTPTLIQALSNLAKLEFTGVGTFEALSTFNYDPARRVRADSQASSFEEVAGPSRAVSSSIEVLPCEEAVPDDESGF
nr:MAG: hypothetical protein [Wufeng shrew permutotetravirus 12]